MSRILLLGLAFSTLVCAEDNESWVVSMDEFTQKALDRSTAKLPRLQLMEPARGILVCAIPLKEANAGIQKHIDPMAFPAHSTSFDPMAHPAPIQACPRR